MRIEHASVPCAVADGERIILYYVDADRGPGMPESIGCAVSRDGIHFTKEQFALEDLPARKAVDPCVLKDDKGRFILYYFASDAPGDPGRGPRAHEIHMAVSDDGIKFREAGVVFARQALVDPDVFIHQGTWFMYVFGGRGTVIATSTGGHRFTYRQELELPGWGTTAPIPLEEGRLRLYAFEQRRPVGNRIRSFLSSDGIRWTPEDGDRLAAGAEEHLTDPFVIRWKGGYRMYFKMEERRGRQLAGGSRPAPPGRGPREGPFRPEGQPPPPGRGPREGPFQPGGRPPGPPAPGPWDSDVIVHRADAQGKVDRVATFERAGVATIARMKDGRIIAAHQHFPEGNEEDFDKVAVRFSTDDGGTWTEPKVIEVTGLPQGMRFPFDPTLVVLPDGRVRLYFTSVRGRTFEDSTPAIYSAISNDGVRYAFEPGVRFAIEGRIVIDCAAVLHKGTFHLFVPDNGPARRREGPGGAVRRERAREGQGYHAISRDGLEFTRVDDVKIDGRRGWLGNAQSDGKRITFCGTGEGLDVGDGRPRAGIWMATSEDGNRWELIAGPAIHGGDPGAVTTRDGGLIVVATGAPRPGTASALRRRPPGPPRGGEGPWNHRILLGTSADGLAWEVGPRVLAERASVPELFAGPDGRAIILFVDADAADLGALVEQPDGSWVRRPTDLRGVDPNVVALTEGGYRAYVKVGREGAVDAYASDDGLRWKRVTEVFRDPRYPQATDPDVFRTGEGWVMLMSIGPRLLRCTSRDGLAFTAREIVELGGAVSDTVAVKGGWRTFFHVNADPRTRRRMHIRSALTADGRTWKVEEGVRLYPPPEGPAHLGVADPAPLERPDGTWLMAVKSFREDLSTPRRPPGPRD